MDLKQATTRRVVVKVGTHSLTNGDGTLQGDRFAQLANQLAALRMKGIEVVLISSGAIAMGVGELHLKKRPSDLPTLQACAAVGQSRLMNAWREAMGVHHLLAAQVLLTREDIRGRRRHLAARETLQRLLSLGTIPVVNENDTISTDEIKFGDNDVLSALVASLLKADLLVILSTIPGLMRDGGKGDLIPLVREIDDSIRALAGGTENPHATGGMVTKLEAADIATRSGCGVFIGSAANPTILTQIVSGEAHGTFFLPTADTLGARKRWIAFFEKSTGSLVLDPGAVKAILEGNRSLLAAGITACEGSFPASAVIDLRDPAGALIARGITAYDAATIRQFKGMDSSRLREAHPERSRLEVIHRDNLVVL
jgi:glutamate 5-kinase